MYGRHYDNTIGMYTKYIQLIFSIDKDHDLIENIIREYLWFDDIICYEQAQFH